MSVESDAEGGRMSEPAWWPAGADEELVRECNCEWCEELVRQLEIDRKKAPGQPSLGAFAGEGDE